MNVECDRRFSGDDVGNNLHYWSLWQTINLYRLVVLKSQMGRAGKGRRIVYNKKHVLPGSECCYIYPKAEKRRGIYTLEAQPPCFSPPVYLLFLSGPLVVPSLD